MTCPTPESRFWIGKPGRMIEIETPDAGFTADVSMSETVHQLLGGGTTVTYSDDVKRSYKFPFGVLDQDGVAELFKLYTRAYGPGPYALLEPTYRNLLDFHLSNSDGGAPELLTVPAGQTLLYDDSFVSPVSPAGVLRWTGAGNGSALVDGRQGSGSGAADPFRAMPSVPGLDVTFSVWLATAAGAASVELAINSYREDGTLLAYAASAAQALTMTFKRFQFTRTLPALPAALAGIALTCRTPSAAPLLITGPQLEFGRVAGEWNPGLGVPRVVFTGGPPVKVPLLGVNNLSFALAQV